MIGCFIDTREMVNDTLDYCYIVRKVIPDFDIILAIPRGGLYLGSVVSSIIAVPLNYTRDVLYW